MKIKAILLGVVMSLSLLSSCSPAFADDGGHAFMPRMEFALPVEFKVAQAEPPREPFLLTGHYSFARKEWSAVAANSFDTLWPDLFGRKGMNVELFGLLGGSGEAAIAGGGLGLVVPIHERISITGGLSLTKRGSTFESFFTELKGIEVGGWIGIAYRVPF